MKATRARVPAGMTKFTTAVPGDVGNYSWPVTFDYNEDGYLGIVQSITGERVLLSPQQLIALKAFTRRRQTATR